MLLTLLGNVGLGLVWGWLIGSASRGTHQRPVWTSVVLSGATLLFCLASFLFSGWRAVIALLVAAGLALFVHLLWQRTIHDRFGPSART
jgi:uncharacterized membrane protein YeiH